jgi:hypothetical protein
MRIRPAISFILPTIVLLLAILTACSAKPGNSRTSADGIKMAQLDGMPSEVLAAPAQVQQAYQFAAANPEVMQQVPCYCGCGDMGHTSNYACYIGGKKSDGSLIFDTHALGCSICVDITMDTMRLLKEGKSISEIKAYIDQTYAQYGPSNMP